jgi:hypothetical protein
VQLVTLPGCLEAVLLQHVMPHARRDNLHLFKTSTLLEADVQALAYYPLQRHALRMLPQLLTAHYLLPTTYLRASAYYLLPTTYDVQAALAEARPELHTLYEKVKGGRPQLMLTEWQKLLQKQLLFGELTALHPSPSPQPEP